MNASCIVIVCSGKGSEHIVALEGDFGSQIEKKVYLICLLPFCYPSFSFWVFLRLGVLLAVLLCMLPFYVDVGHTDVLLLD